VRSDGFLSPARPTPADGATLGMTYVVALTIIPAGLVVSGIPLSISPATLLGLGMAVCWLLAHFTYHLGMAKGFTAIRLMLYLYVLAMLAAYCSANYRYLPGDEIKAADRTAVLIVALAGVALLICDGVTSRDRLDFLLKSVAVCSSISALIAALQFALDIDLTRYLVLPGLKYTSVSAGHVFERAAFRRVAGTTGNPIEFGVLCAMTLPLALHFAFQAKNQGRSARWWWVSSALIAAGLLFSVSRSAVLSVGCAGMILLIGWPRRRRIIGLITTVAFLVAARAAFPGLLGTLFSLFANFSNDDSVQYRTHDYPIAAAEISRDPLLGHGVGTFYAPKHIVFDNQYILTLVDGGVIGFATFVGLFLVSLWVALRLSLFANRDADRDLARTLLACAIVPVVGSITFDLISFSTVSGIYFVLVGAIAALQRNAPVERFSLSRSGSGRRVVGPGERRTALLDTDRSHMSPDPKIDTGLAAKP
jgi:O-antigen ligase